MEEQLQGEFFLHIISNYQARLQVMLASQKHQEAFPPPAEEPLLTNTRILILMSWNTTLQRAQHMETLYHKNANLKMLKINNIKHLYLIY